MKSGIAFIRGIGIFGKRSYPKQKILSCLRKIKNKNIKIIGIYQNDNIIFLKSDNIHYATVGRKIEKSLKKCFDEKFYVTTRALSTLRGAIKNFDYETF